MTSSTKKINNIIVSLCVSLFALSTLNPSIFAQQATSTLRVSIKDQAGKPIVAAKIEVYQNGSLVNTVTTNEKGEAEITKLAVGAYDITASKEHFEPLTESSIELKAGGSLLIEFTLPPKASLNESVTVDAGSGKIVEKTSSTPAELQRAVIKELPNRPATVTDALPLLPGVVRSPQGEIKISGSGENRSALIVNSADVTDPATGQFGLTVPVDSVETINVFKTPYLAQYGRFSAGVVSVETRRGGDKWNFEFNDPLPEFRIFSGHLRGIREASPRVVFNGPLIGDKLYFSEGLEYDLQKRPVRTLPFPVNETKQESFNSFTQFDYLFSTTHTLTATLHVAPRRMQFANLDFFNPQPVTPNFNARDYTGTLIDRLTIGSNLLESTIAVKQATGDVYGQGSDEMTLTPTINRGNFFSQQNRNTSRIEWLESYALAPIKAMGDHNLRFGSSIARTNNDGEFRASAVNIVDAQDRLLRRIDFVGGSPFDLTDLETSFFGQDHWVLHPKFSVDLGARFERQGITETVRVAPRIGLAWTPFKNQQTVVRGGFGLFYDRVPLNVYAFDRYPEQQITTFDGNSNIISVQQFANITDRAEKKPTPFVFSKDNIGNFAPYSATWSVEVEHPLTDYLRIRANYLQSNSHGVIILTPKVVQERDAFVLSGSGRTRYRQLELTTRYTFRQGQAFFSYVRSRTEGDFNEFNNYLGNFPFPVMRPNFFTRLSGDLPNRFLAWGSINLPSQFRISPIVEYRNGFPYSSFDEAQNFSSVPNSQRYPNFFSADARVSKDFRINKEYSLRLSVSGFNLTNHFNPTSVHPNIADPQYNLFFGNYKRRFRLDFDVLF
jgi:hypothetical protein